MVLSELREAQLQVFDTECKMGLEPIETSFYFSLSDPGIDPYSCSLLSEPCSHAPSPDELMTAPFYPNPSQCILVLFASSFWYFVINMELLLELTQKWGGQRVEWDQSIEIISSGSCVSDCTWISGCRLFYILPGEVDDSLNYLQIYDFSHASHAKNLNVIKGKREQLMSSSISLYKLPCIAPFLLATTLTVGHDSIVVCVVSGLIALSPSPLSNVIFLCIALLRTQTPTLTFCTRLCTCGTFEGIERALRKVVTLDWLVFVGRSGTVVCDKMDVKKVGTLDPRWLWGGCHKRGFNMSNSDIPCAEALA